MRQSLKTLGLAAFCVALAAPASAYTGPGLGMATITVILGFLASIFIAIFAVIWYPFKRMLKKRKAAKASSDDRAADAPDGAE